MNDQPVENDQPQGMTDMVGSPGIAVREARKKMGMSIEELATQTRLSKATLEALEHDQFEKLLEPVYVRGYYRKCAGILEIEEKPLIAAYDSLYTPPPKAQPTKLRLASGGDLGSAPRVSGRLAIIGPILAIIIGIAFWMSRQPSSLVSGPQTVTLLEPGIQGSIEPSDTMPPLDDADSQRAGPVDSQALPNPATAQAEGARLASGRQEGGVNKEIAATSRLAGSEQSEPQPAEPVPEPVAAGTALKLRFDAISWARIEDASGTLLLSGIIPAGESRELDGQPPYSVFLGNGPGVNIEFQGNAVDIKPFVKGNATARFSVPVSGG